MRETRWAVWHIVFLSSAAFAFPQLPGGWSSWTPIQREKSSVGHRVDGRDEPQLSKRAPTSTPIDVNLLGDVCPGQNNTLAKTEIETIFEIQCGMDHYGGGKYPSAINMGPPVQVASLGACITVCDMEPGCKGVAFRPQGSTFSPCYLKNDLSTGVQTDKVIGAVVVPNAPASSSSAADLSTNLASSVTESLSVPSLSTLGLSVSSSESSITEPTTSSVVLVASSTGPEISDQLSTSSGSSGSVQLLSSSEASNYILTQPLQPTSSLRIVEAVVSAEDASESIKLSTFGATSQFYATSHTDSHTYGTQTENPGTGVPVPATKSVEPVSSASDLPAVDTLGRPVTSSSTSALPTQLFESESTTLQATSSKVPAVVKLGGADDSEVMSSAEVSLSATTQFSTGRSIPSSAWNISRSANSTVVPSTPQTTLSRTAFTGPSSYPQGPTISAPPFPRPDNRTSSSSASKPSLVMPSFRPTSRPTVSTNSTKTLNGTSTPFTRPSIKLSPSSNVSSSYIQSAQNTSLPPSSWPTQPASSRTAIFWANSTLRSQLSTPSSTNATIATIGSSPTLPFSNSGPTFTRRPSTQSVRPTSSMIKVERPIVLPENLNFTSVKPPPFTWLNSTQTRSPTPSVFRVNSTRSSVPTPPVFRPNSTRSSLPTPPVFRPNSTRVNSPTPPVFWINSTRTSSQTPQVFRPNVTRSSLPTPPVFRPNVTRSSSLTPPVFNTKSRTTSLPTPPVFRLNSTRFSSPTQPPFWPNSTRVNTPTPPIFRPNSTGPIQPPFWNKSTVTSLSTPPVLRPNSTGPIQPPFQSSIQTRSTVTSSPTPPVFSPHSTGPIQPPFRSKSTVTSSPTPPAFRPSSTGPIQPPFRSRSTVTSSPTPPVFRPSNAGPIQPPFRKTRTQSSSTSSSWQTVPVSSSGGQKSISGKILIPPSKTAGTYTGPTTYGSPRPYDYWTQIIDSRDVSAISASTATFAGSSKSSTESAVPTPSSVVTIPTSTSSSVIVTSSSATSSSKQHGPWTSLPSPPPSLSNQKIMIKVNGSWIPYQPPSTSSTSSSASSSTLILTSSSTSLSTSPSTTSRSSSSTQTSVQPTTPISLNLKKPIPNPTFSMHPLNSTSLSLDSTAPRSTRTPIMPSYTRSKSASASTSPSQTPVMPSYTQSVYTFTSSLQTVTPVVPSYTRASVSASASASASAYKNRPCARHGPHCHDDSDANADKTETCISPSTSPCISISTSTSTTTLASETVTHIGGCTRYSTRSGAAQVTEIDGTRTGMETDGECLSLSQSQSQCETGKEMGTGCESSMVVSETMTGTSAEGVKGSATASASTTATGVKAKFSSAAAAGKVRREGWMMGGALVVGGFLVLV